MKAMALHNTLEATALRCPSYVDDLAGLEQIHIQDLPNLMLRSIVGLELAQMTHQPVGLCKMALLRFSQILRLGIAKSNLYGIITVTILRANLRDDARTGFDDRHRDGLSGRAEDLGHADFTAQQTSDHNHTSAAYGLPASASRSGCILAEQRTENILFHDHFVLCRLLFVLRA
jgi:hypothetical protein